MHGVACSCISVSHYRLCVWVSLSHRTIGVFSPSSPPGVYIVQYSASCTVFQIMLATSAQRGHRSSIKLKRAVKYSFTQPHRASRQGVRPNHSHPRPSSYSVFHLYATHQCHFPLPPTHRSLFAHLAPERDAWQPHPAHHPANHALPYPFHQPSPTHPTRHSFHYHFHNDPHHSAPHCAAQCRP